MTEKLDTKVIAKLAEILDKTNLSELEYEDEGCRICLTRQTLNVAPMQTTAMPAQVAAPVATIVEQKAVATPSAPDYSNAIKSPMVGVVYLSNDPSTPNYVKEGDTVEVGATICLIEAMKTFNPVKADKAGKVVKILVTSGSPVEYGEPLIIIE